MSVPSKPLVLRVITMAIAQLAAERSGSTEAGLKALVPGRTTISTPMRPTTTAPQRRMPTFSPSSGMESAVMKSG